MPDQLTDEQIAKDITSLVARVIERPEDEVAANRDKHFVKDLKVDSLLALEILAGIEKKFGIELPEEALEEITTLDATIALAQRRCREQRKG